MGIPLRTLIIEDSEDDTLLFIRLLRKNGYNPVYERVETSEAMHEAFESKTWDIIISDYNMPRFSGLAALALYKDKGLDIPFIIVSGTIGEEIAAEAMVSGAHDYVMKNNLTRLVPAIQRELGEAELRRGRKQAEEQILIFRYFMEASGQGLGMATLDGGMTYVNQTLCRFLGEEKPEDVYKKKFALYYPQEMRERLEKEVLPAVMSKGQWIGELALISTDGKYTPTIENFFLIRDKAGNPLCLADVITDITERKQAEKSLKLSEEKYRSIFENATEGIFRTAPEGRFITVNSAMAHMHGFASPEEMITGITDIGKQLFVNSEDRERYRSILEEKGIVNNFDAQIYRKDGNTLWTSTNARAVRDAGGNVSYFEGTSEDITQRKQAEEELLQTLERLRKSLIGTIQALSSTVETRDPYTAGHQRKVSNLARAIAQEMGLPNDTVDTIRMAGIIHDIGKISVPAEILAKPGKITDIEMSLIEVHSQTGYDILKDVGLPYPIAEIVLQHHERLDGSGYPQGLKGEEIFFESQIISVADVVEAIASHRPYRPGFGIDVALEEIEKNKGILYGSGVVEACLKLFREKQFSFE
jgi:PAS domain S-box-containing protein/putative nucleotidyltransferase with HDIG domain